MCSSPTLRYVGTIAPCRGWMHPLHDHPTHHELIVVVSGAAEVELDGRPLRLEAGDAAHYPQGVPHVERAVGDELFELLFVSFEQDAVPHPGAVVHDHHGRMRSMLRWLLELSPDDPRGDPLLAALLAERAACATTPADPLELAVRRYLRAHLDQAIGVDDMAAVAGLSRWHFTRRFSALTGVPPARYLERMRVEAATALLQASALPLKAIADQVGLKDPYHLSRVVKRVTGRAPGALRSRG